MVRCAHMVLCEYSRSNRRILTFEQVCHRPGSGQVRDYSSQEAVVDRHNVCQ
jgi:hypothetical protein